MGKIINLFEKPLDKERFQISIKKEAEIKKQSHCDHEEIEIDNQVDEHNCLNCGKIFNAHEYLIFKAESNTSAKMHSYHLRNELHFLEIEVNDLSEKVKYLKSEKQKLLNNITRTKTKINNEKQL